MQSSADIYFISLPNILSIDDPKSTVKRYLRSSTSYDDSVGSPEEKKRKESSSSDDIILEALGMAEG